MSQDKTFYDYFKENMLALGLPLPTSGFESFDKALDTVNNISTVWKTFGTAVTVKELIGAGTKLEILKTASALTASFYVGALIGSVAVAAGRTLSGGTSIADVLLWINSNNLNVQNCSSIITANPEICEVDIPARSNYRVKAQ